MTDDEPDCARKGKRWVTFHYKPYRTVKKMRKVKR
jgi:hypothetical protein